MSFLYCVVKVICIIISKFAFRVKVNGIENLPKGKGFLICCNHQSIWDMAVLIAYCPFQINFMAKKEIFKNKLFSAVLLGLGIFPVSRGQGDLSAIKKAMELINEGKVVGIFPEGTRRPLQRPEKIKAGAALIALQTGADIVPAAINYNGKIKLFGKITLNVGTPFSSGQYINEESGESVSRTQLKALTKDIANNIIELWEK